MNFLTNFGDLAVLLPLSAVMLIWLLSLRPRRSVIWWLVALGLCVGLTALLKIYLFVCQPSAELQSPSGHTSLGTLVYGAIAFVVAAECGHWRRYFVVLAGLGLIAGIGISRVALGRMRVREFEHYRFRWNLHFRRPRESRAACGLPGPPLSRVKELAVS